MSFVIVAALGFLSEWAVSALSLSSIKLLGFCIVSRLTMDFVISEVWTSLIISHIKSIYVNLQVFRLLNSLSCIHSLMMAS